MSFLEELDTSDYFCSEKKRTFLDVSFDLNISIEYIDCKSKQHVEIPTRKPCNENTIDTQKNKTLPQHSIKIDKLNISFDPDDSIGLLNSNVENYAHSPGIIIIQMFLFGMMCK